MLQFKKNNILLFLLLLGFFLFSGFLFAEQEIKIKIHKDKSSLTGIYIPKSLEEVLAEFDKILPKDFKKKIHILKSEDEMFVYRFVLGKWIRKNWGLWDLSRLALYFKTAGIDDPDHMCGVILRSLWRHIHHQKIELEEEIKSYKNLLQQIKEIKKAKANSD